MELAYSRESAHVTVLYLGQGRLAVELDEAGLALRHVWTATREQQRIGTRRKVLISR